MFSNDVGHWRSFHVFLLIQFLVNVIADDYEDTFLLCVVNLFLECLELLYNNFELLLWQVIKISFE